MESICGTLHEVKIMVDNDEFDVLFIEQDVMSGLDLVLQDDVILSPLI